MKTPYTENSKEMREFLEQQGFDPLTFYQGKKYIAPLVSTFANINNEWKVYDYTTFDRAERYHYYLDFDKFGEEIKILAEKG